MATSHEELDSFHRFAKERLTSGETPDSLDELLVEWYEQSARAQINAAIRAGLADVEHGRVESVDSLNEGLRRELGLSPE